MPIPSSINDLSTSVGSNSPAGSDPPTDGDNYLRAHAAFIAQLRDSVLGATRFLPEDYSDNVQSALDAASAAGGGRVWLKPGKTYTMTGRISYPAGGLVGIMSDGTATLYWPASVLTNTSLSTSYTSTSCAVSMSGLTGSPFTTSKRPYLVGVRLVYQTTDGRKVDAIEARNIEDLHIWGVEFEGWPVGCDIKASSLRRGMIGRTVHSGRASTHVWGSQPQSTAIEIDNDRVDSEGSRGTTIFAPTIRNFTITGQSTSAWNHQTDGIHIAHQAARAIKIISPDIENVGEGIDIFGSDCTVQAPTIRQARLYGIKLVHGASRNVIQGGTISDVGLAGVVFAGSTISAVGDTARNVLMGTTITSVDYLNERSGGEGCVYFTDNGGTTGKPADNSAIGVVCSPGQYGTYGWRDASTGSNNFGDSLVVVSGSATLKKALTSPATGGVRLIGTTSYSRDIAA